jgi:hypothetical protein
VLVAAAEEFGEAGDQVGLREHHVDRCEHFELFGQLLDALTQVLREVDRELGAVAGELGDARGDDDAVDRRLRPVAFQQAEKAEPLAAVFLVHRVAAGRVEQDPFGREEPVAVARAADAVDHRAVLVGERELQAGVQHRAALARGRVADHDVPRQFVQRGAADTWPIFDVLIVFTASDRRVQHVEVGGLRVGRERGRGGRRDLAGFGLFFEHLAELLVRALHAPAAPQRDGEPQHEDRRERERGPQQRQLQHVGDDEENRR